MENIAKRLDARTIALLVINLGSMLLLANSIFVIKLYAMQYGEGQGAIAQALYNGGGIVTPQLQSIAYSLADLHRSLLESYLNLCISFVIAIIAFILYINRSKKAYEGMARRYLLLHGFLILIYLGLLLIMHSTFEFTFFSLHMYAAYLAFALCIGGDGYLEYKIHSRIPEKRASANISLNPATPFTNLQLIKEGLLSNMHGSIKIIDKHFNSGAMYNLSRLFEGNLEKIESITVITSGEMLDANFGKNYMDMRSELGNSSVGFEVRIMSMEDGTDQHERFIIDEKSAYKIPPINIINKKSEHIVRINFSDARKRYEHLERNALKYENFVLKGRNQAQEG